MRKYYWTTHEDAFLQEQYQKLGPKKCADLLHRPYQAITCRAKQLDLRMYGRVNWTNSQDDFIIRMYKEHSADWIAEQLSVPLTALEKRIQVISASKKWKYRHVTTGGYIRLGSSRGKYPLQGAEHRLLMEELIGRKLSFNEVVHHINRDTTDNDPENLVIMTRAQHVRLHKLEDKQSKNSSNSNKNNMDDSVQYSEGGKL